MYVYLSHCRFRRQFDDKLEQLREEVLDLLPAFPAEVPQYVRPRHLQEDPPQEGVAGG